MVNAANNRRVMALTLFSGENELEANKESVLKQRGIEVEHKIISHMPNHTAHKILYKTIMENSHKYELFIKLDADMVFLRNTSVLEILDFFERDSDLDQLTSVVYDHPSDTNIFGLHAFSNRVSWPDREEELFVDPDPVKPGYKKLLADAPAPFATHMSNPSIFQAYLYGVHRSSKIIQKGHSQKNLYQVSYQISLLESVAMAARKLGGSRRLAVLLGASDYIGGRVGQIVDKTNHSYDENSVTERIMNSNSNKLISYWLSWRGSKLLRLRYYTLIRAKERIKAGVRKFL